MSIQIVDNFSLGLEKPIDNRFVVGNGEYYINKDSIDLKYVGLRIWDKNDDKAYVWKGSSWEEESSDSSSGTVGPGTTNYVPKFITSTTIGDSIIYEEDETVFVEGRLISQRFDGPGTDITQLNASNITVGVISLSRIQGDENHIIVGQGLGLSSDWTNLNDITVGNSTKINVTNTNSSSIHYLTMSDNPGTAKNLYTSNLIKYEPSTGMLDVDGFIRTSSGIRGRNDINNNFLSFTSNTNVTDSDTWILLTNSDYTREGELALGGKYISLWSNSDDSSSGIPRLTINSTGNIRIGGNTASLLNDPTINHKLDINGNISEYINGYKILKLGMARDWEFTQKGVNTDDVRLALKPTTSNKNFVITDVDTDDVTLAIRTDSESNKRRVAINYPETTQGITLDVNGTIRANNELRGNNGLLINSDGDLRIDAETITSNIDGMYMQHSNVKILNSNTINENILQSGSLSKNLDSVNQNLGNIFITWSRVGRVINASISIQIVIAVISHTDIIIPTNEILPVINDTMQFGSGILGLVGDVGGDNNSVAISIQNDNFTMHVRKSIPLLLPPEAKVLKGTFSYVL